MSLSVLSQVYLIVSRLFELKVLVQHLNPKICHLSITLKSRYSNLACNLKPGRLSKKKAKYLFGTYSCKFATLEQNDVNILLNSL